MQNLDQVIEKMRAVGQQLVPYNYPKGDPALEGYTNSIKTKNVCIDGYHLTIHFNKSEYGRGSKKIYLETLQIFGKNSPFLPFYVVAKLAKKFLGSHHLFLTELLRENRKIYLWNVYLDKRGIPIPQRVDNEAEICTYEGLTYTYMDHNSINFH